MFVTGAAGFIGGWLARSILQRGADVLCLVLPQESEITIARELREAGGQILVGSVEDFALLRRAVAEWKADAVFHLAAININFGADISPLAIFETNLRGTWHLLEVCRMEKSVRRIVLASSAEAEGLEWGPGAGSPRLPRRPYQVSKVAAELIGHAFADTYGLSVAMARSDNIYGGGDLNWQRLIPGTILALHRGERPVLRSNGASRRDYLFVEDMVEAYLATAARLDEPSMHGEVFHFATGVGTPALEVVSRLCVLMKREDLTPVVKNDSPNERTDAPRSTERELRILGWKSRTALDLGLEKTVGWYRGYFESHPPP